MMETEPTPWRRLDDLRGRLRARAAGWWRVGADRLEQVAFSPAPDLPVEVARAFAEATRSVPMARVELGIVQAALSGEPAISRAAELPAEAGSGFWLRRFGAARSVAVPLRDDRGSVVVSLALADLTPEDAAIVAAIRAEAGDWTAV